MFLFVSRNVSAMSLVVDYMCDGILVNLTIRLHVLNKLAQGVTFLICTGEVPGSGLGRYPE
jgi:hypothetical protein